MSSRINRGGRPIPGAFNAEFTPGQMVIGICVLFFVVAVSFGAGVLVGRHDPSLHKATGTEVATNTKPEPAKPSADKPAPAPTPSPPRAAEPPVPPLPPAPKHPETTNGPHEVTLPPLPPSSKTSNKDIEVPPAPKPEPAKEAAKEPEKATAKETPVPPPAKPVEQPLPDKTPKTADTKTAAEQKSDLPPLPTATKSSVASEIDKQTAEKTKKAEAAPPKSAKQAKLDEDMKSDLLDPIDPNAKPAKNGKAAQKNATTKADTPPATAAASGGFGIQVGAFPGPNRDSQAADLKKRLDASGLHSEIRMTKDKSLMRVVLVGFADRESAIKALEGLKQRPGFEKAFIQKLNGL